MKKNEILSKSLELFANQGYFGTSMDDIAKSVGIKKASLYSHYSGKESIFTAVFNSILEDYTSFINDLTTCNEDTNCSEKLTNIFSSYVFEFFLFRKGFFGGGSFCFSDGERY